MIFPSILNFRTLKWLYPSIQRYCLSTKYDLVVIGGSSGGIAAAKEASSLGAKVVVLDYVPPTPANIKWGLGGTIIPGSCISKKLMHQAALLKDAIHDAKWYGWNLGGRCDHSWENLRHAIQSHVKSAENFTKLELADKRIEYINGMATFKNNTTVQFTTDRGEHNVTGKYFLIAVGSKPRYPDVFGASEYGITSDDIFNLPKPPGNTMIIGAGYVGLECAGFLNGLGYDSTVMVRSIPLRGFDQQMAGIVINEMKHKGVEFLERSIPKSIKKSSQGKILVSWTNISNETFKREFDTVLFAVGRQALTKELNVERAGVIINGVRGRINTINEQTNVDHIFAVGDVLHNKLGLTSVAILSGTLLARRLFGNSNDKMDYDNIPTTIFTPLEYGFVGLSEENAISIYGENHLEVYHSYYKPTEFFIPKRSVNNCYLKVIALREDEQKVLGMHYIGPQAGEILQGFSTAMKCNLTVRTLMDTVGIHPTLAEEFTRIKITKRSGKDPKPASCCS